MTGQQPATEAEMSALREIGYRDLAPHEVLKVYRVGFADGRTPPAPRVFRVGDPEPGPEVDAVLDRDRDVWLRKVDCWDCSAEIGDWTHALDYGPLVACAALPDYAAAVLADDDARRAVAESAVLR